MVEAEISDVFVSNDGENANSENINQMNNYYSQRDKPYFFEPISRKRNDENSEKSK